MAAFMDEAEWDKLAPYWYSYNVSIFGAATFAFSGAGIKQVQRFRGRREL
jgi:hypothetical protein